MNFERAWQYQFSKGESRIVVCARDVSKSLLEIVFVWNEDLREVILEDEGEGKESVMEALQWGTMPCPSGIIIAADLAIDSVCVDRIYNQLYRNE
ncbi:unnamed protein product [Sphenostylis stenocarpa]|uniref:Uncharacterized protein n=1 Tax=Sphenostylis stenocarpa TaxID=92480 RepID=A0AA86VQ23_9FABA|nr:unnamed protein product [Sphenostylis stenocarpa]